MTHSNLEGVLEMWTVYYDLKDYPGRYVARKFWVTKSGASPSKELVTGATLDDVRKQIPPGLVCMQRYAADDPCIVEVWL